MPAKRFVHALLNAGIKVVRPSIVEELPHDSTAFTQGLAFCNGKLYESTGLDDASSIRRINPDSGEIERSKALLGHWGEGLAVQKDLVVQLTWKSQKAMVYRLEDLSKIDEWHYDGEGWGLAATADGFVMTEGSNSLLFRDTSFNLLRTVKVHRKLASLSRLNDLECARGHLLVHRLWESFLYEIDPSNGSIVRLIDAAELIERAQPRRAEDVFNGVAYDSNSDTFFMTGKRWPILFRVEIPSDS